MYVIITAAYLDQLGLVFLFAVWLREPIEIVIRLRAPLTAGSGYPFKRISTGCIREQDNASL